MNNSETHGVMTGQRRDEPIGTPRLRHRILNAGRWAGGGFLLDKLIATGQLAILARILTPPDFGVMAASAAVLLAMLTISELGVDSALIAKEHVSEEDLATAWSLSVLRGLTMAIGIWVLAGVISRLMHMPVLEPLLRVHAWALIIQGVHNPALAMLTKQLDLKRRVTVDLARRGVETTVTLTVAILYRTVWALVIGQLAGLAVGCVLSFWVSPFLPRWSLKRAAVDYFMKYGSRLNVTTLCMFGVMTGGELVVGRVLGAEALGLYQVALALPLLIGARATALMQQISVPTYSSLQQDRRGIARVFDLQIGLVGIMYVPLALMIGTLAPFFVPFFFGQQWIAIIDPLKVLCLYAVCSGYASVMASLHYGVRRPDLQMKSWMGQCVVYLVMIVPLATSLGVLGAAISLTVSYLFGMLLQVMGTRHLLGWSCHAALVSLARTGGIGVLGGAFILMLQMQHSLADAWMPAIAAALASGSFGWYLWRIERPRLNALWSYQSEGAQA